MATAFKFTVNGVNMLPYIEENGISWQKNDLDSDESGRTLDGVMHRARVATKVRLDISCKPLDGNEAAIVLKAISPQYVTVRYIDPEDGDVTKTMYSNNKPAVCASVDPDTWTVKWTGIEFPLIER